MAVKKDWKQKIMTLRYRSSAIPDAPVDFQHLAEEILGTVQWEDAHTGYCECPGKHLHTAPSGNRDCRVYLDASDGYAPTVFCFHNSCTEVTAQTNFRLRSSMGRISYRTNGQYHTRMSSSDIISDPFSTFLNTCFHPTDILSIAPGTLPDGGTRAIPEHGGVNVLTRDQWLKRAMEKGGIERLFSTRNGLYIRINPVKEKSSGTDKDVTAFRHTLIESDDLPKADQERILRDSGLPIAALIDSGGSSIHAWVRVDASSREEYHQRRERVWNALPDTFPIDQKNKNPSRFSRCPGGLRGEGMQKLLAVNLGPPSFEEWENEADGLGLQPPLRVSQLGDYDVSNDPNTVLGNRWLCKGGSLIVVGQSGIGKSSFSMQLSVLWALGQSVFNIKPIRPLKSLIIQAENDIGDLAEMFQGVREGLNLTSEQFALLEENLVFYRDTIHSGEDFAKTADILIKRHNPDLVWGDPLLNYIGDDASQQRVVSEFCGRLLNPISERTGIIWCFMHHTGKPSSDSKARSHWTGTDYAYSGLGSSALTNWAREVAVLNRAKTPEGSLPTFRFELCKRRKRAGMIDTQGNPTESIFVRHGETGIRWEQCDPPVDKTKPKGIYKVSKGRPKVVDEAIPEFEGLSSLSRELIAELSAQYGVSQATIKRRWKDFREKNNNQPELIK